MQILCEDKRRETEKWVEERIRVRGESRLASSHYSALIQEKLQAGLKSDLELYACQL